MYPTPGQKHQLAKLFGCVCWRNAFLRNAAQTRTCRLE
ncbi:MAG: helix-turn-helix domain-containing protein [Trichodesmium sp. MO_231.B1]|nr:helix-turn-helix domain-containing protein [Okeania sp. SIO2F4]MDJ0518838.1 helix-turn-helix domain-containing protein [Trichodesmium sp. MO_231.B1]